MSNRSLRISLENSEHKAITLKTRGVRFLINTHWAQMFVILSIPDIAILLIFWRI
jgi:hypothetical protein